MTICQCGHDSTVHSYRPEDTHCNVWGQNGKCLCNHYRPAPDTAIEASDQACAAYQQLTPIEEGGLDKWDALKLAQAENTARLLHVYLGHLADARQEADSRGEKVLTLILPAAQADRVEAFIAERLATWGVEDYVLTLEAYHEPPAA